MVKLTRIYTRTGDTGQTRLADMSLISKTDPRVDAYGDVDEANSVLGIVTSLDSLPQPLQEALQHIQNELFDVGADLATPLASNPEWEPLRIVQSSIDRLEAWCDEFAEPLPALHSFILPGGSTAAAHLHLARTVVRRAERTAWAAVEHYGTAPGTPEHPGGINLLAVTYLNRLSDLLFIASRVANRKHGDVLWVPGADRTPTEPAALARRRRITQQQNKL